MRGDGRKSARLVEKTTHAPGAKTGTVEQPRGPEQSMRSDGQNRGATRPSPKTLHRDRKNTRSGDQNRGTIRATSPSYPRGVPAYHRGKATMPMHTCSALFQKKEIAKDTFCTRWTLSEVCGTRCRSQKHGIRVRVEISSLSNMNSDGLYSFASAHHSDGNELKRA